MTLKTAFFILAFTVFPLASQAFVSGGLHAQSHQFEELLQKVALIGEESGRVVSDDPDTHEAQVEEATGYGLICGKDVGTLNLIEHNGHKVLVGTAHGFYKDGKIGCNKDFGEFFPDDHYDSNPHIDHKRGYAFELPPLNHEEAIEGSDSNALFPGAEKDFVVLKIKDTSLFNRQVGGQRTSIKLSKKGLEDLENLSKEQNIYISSGRENFHNYKKVSYQDGCSIKPLPKGIASKSFKHNCDTGLGSSGALLKYDSPTGATLSPGLNVAEHPDDLTEERFQNTYEGNYFIPAKYIVESLDKIID